ncbi:hypothetical protein Dsin_025280 [Dipteronia sinensis]|uniref:Reverse transcriptase zinc-binding domain-containing protein n=1 Tax=Dipteronia sinensis TaxID=43782 RepID=A0AAD9ZVB9_9ROSI|nr:hypothetical protein Dsin_025280 [Dipteronia sinensis]
MSIPVSNVPRDDSYCWHLTKDGGYTVRSGYKVGISMEEGSSISGSRGMGFRLRKIWELELHSKIKIFIWKACPEWLPTYVNLARRKVPMRAQCHVCFISYESTAHVLWSCSGLKVVWSMFGFHCGWKSGDTVCFQDFFNGCVNRLD